MSTKSASETITRDPNWLGPAVAPGEMLLERRVLHDLEKQPDHPGLANYLIHSCDVPPLAPRAIDAARRYAKIAPSSPHALHMPSHIFTRVGLWHRAARHVAASQRGDLLPACGHTGLIA